jgi:cell division transport system ATP-binding protein
MESQIIAFENLCFAYPKRDLFHNVNLHIQQGEFYYLTGLSGVGKSTFLKLIYLGVQPTKGTLSIFGRSVKGLSYDEKSKMRRNMGIVFQDFKLLEHLTVLENVALPLRVRGLSGKRSADQARELLKWVGVSNLDRFPATLSGGEQQRTAIARAVIARPNILLADEPTGNIDDETAIHIFHLFEELHKIGTTVIVATHNESLIHAFPHPTLHCHDKSITLHSHFPSQYIANAG